MTEPYGPNFVVVSPRDLVELRLQAERCAEYLATAKRVQADFVNYQERVRTEKQEARLYSLESFLKDLLPALDVFETTLKQVEDPVIGSGIQIIQKELFRVLAKWGVQPIETIGQAFDPRLHQAVSVEECADKPDRTVLEELRPGYRLHERVLMAALVRVSRAPADGGQGGQATA
jgi:molecular chaperone GrpE